jgi:pheromone shutdown protein TraB
MNPESVSQGKTSRDRSREMNLDGSKVFIVPTVKGLVSEAVIVKESIRRYTPDAIAVHIGKEEMKGLKSVVDGKVKMTYLTSYERVYALKLSRFGEVQVPPPTLVESLRMARDLKIPIFTLDLSDEEYTDIYTRYISGVTMIRNSLRLKRINRKKFKSQTPEDYAMEWDRISNRYRGFRLLEEHRERYQAKRIIKLCKKHDRLLCVVEYERSDGIIEAIEKDRTFNRG